mmetsp:Transcript_25534/g.43066  ORF Transcript_25534/g.43066 Transcript_25534/m.43066 type:complete len:98 (-) Transcript_25534:27-320(-)
MMGACVAVEFNTNPLSPTTIYRQTAMVGDMTVKIVTKRIATICILIHDRIILYMLEKPLWFYSDHFEKRIMWIPKMAYAVSYEYYIKQTQYLDSKYK